MNSLAFCRWWVLMLVGGLAVAAPRSVHADDGDRPALTASKAIVREAADYGFRRWLRNRVWEDEDDARYGLQLDADWQKAAAASPDLPLVVLVHGFNSNPSRNAPVMVPVREAGYPTAAFAYPNDWDLTKSAALLSRQLKAFAAEHPERRVALVTHSMGGLVARECIENDELNPGIVDRLVMIAPPSQGTLIAHLAVATDVWEHWLGRDSGGAWTRWRDSVIDGLGEAADDLVPGSPFLTELNGRPRRPGVRYAIFLGAGAAVSEGEMTWMRTALQKASGRSERFKGATSKFEVMLGDMEEIVDGKGDGVVAIKRGRLDGVDDTLILPFGHLMCTGEPDNEVVRQVQQELLARLR